MIEQHYSPARAAEMLEVSVRTIQRLIASGELKMASVSSLVRIPESSIHAYLTRYDAAPCLSERATVSTRSGSQSQGMDELNAVFQRELRTATPKR